MIDTYIFAKILSDWRESGEEAEELYLSIKAILPPDPKPVLVTFDFADDDYPDSDDSDNRTAILTCPWCKAVDCFAEVNIAEDWCVLDDVTADADGNLGCVTRSPSGDYFGDGFVCTNCEKPVDIDIELDYCR